MKTNVDFYVRLDNGILISDSVFTREERKYVTRYNDCAMIIK